jgi:ABC-type polysaccharide/polyol phosphate export permease
VPRAARHREDELQIFRPYHGRLPPLREYVFALWHRRKFVSTLARTELRAAHFNTLLGQFWTVLNPLMLAGVYFLLIQVLRGGRAGIDRFTLLVGCVFLFYYSRNSVQGGARSIVAGSGLILNTVFPRALLPLTAVLEALLRLIPSLLVYAVIHVATRQPITAALTVIPLLLVIQTVFNLGVAMLVATIGVYFRDVINALQYLTRTWLYATPVIYRVEDLTPGLKAVLSWNPLFHLFASYQAILTGSGVRSYDVLVAAVWSLVFFAAGSLIFLVREREFAVRI